MDNIGRFEKNYTTSVGEDYKSYKESMREIVKSELSEYDKQQEKRLYKQKQEDVQKDNNDEVLNSREKLERKNQEFALKKEERAKEERLNASINSIAWSIKNQKDLIQKDVSIVLEHMEEKISKYMEKSEKQLNRIDKASINIEKKDKELQEKKKRLNKNASLINVLAGDVSIGSYLGSKVHKAVRTTKAGRAVSKKYLKVKNNIKTKFLDHYAEGDGLVSGLANVYRENVTHKSINNKQKRMKAADIAMSIDAHRIKNNQNVLNNSLNSLSNAKTGSDAYSALSDMHGTGVLNKPKLSIDKKGNETSQVITDLTKMLPSLTGKPSPDSDKLKKPNIKADKLTANEKLMLGYQKDSSIALVKISDTLKKIQEDMIDEQDTSIKHGSGSSGGSGSEKKPMETLKQKIKDWDEDDEEDDDSDWSLMDLFGGGGCGRGKGRGRGKGKKGKGSRFVRKAKIAAKRAGRKIGKVGKGAMSMFGNVGKGAMGVAGNVGKGAAMSMLSKAGGLLKFAGPLGRVVAAGLALKDGYDGWQNANENLGLDKDKKASFTNKASSATGSIINGVTFGLADTKNTSQGINNLMGGNDTITKYEKMGIINHNTFGNSDITDWKKLSLLKPEEIQKIIDIDDWSDDDLKRLQAEKVAAASKPTQVSKSAPKPAPKTTPTPAPTPTPKTTPTPAPKTTPKVETTKAKSPVKAQEKKPEGRVVNWEGQDIKLTANQAATLDKLQAEGKSQAIIGLMSSLTAQQSKAKEIPKMATPMTLSSVTNTGDISFDSDNIDEIEENPIERIKREEAEKAKREHKPLKRQIGSGKLAKAASSTVTKSVATTQDEDEDGNEENPMIEIMKRLDEEEAERKKDKQHSVIPVHKSSSSSNDKPLVVNTDSALQELQDMGLDPKIAMYYRAGVSELLDSGITLNELNDFYKENVGNRDKMSSYQETMYGSILGMMDDSNTQLGDGVNRGFENASLSSKEIKSASQTGGMISGEHDAIEPGVKGGGAGGGGSGFSFSGGKIGGVDAVSSDVSGGGGSLDSASAKAVLAAGQDVNASFNSDFASTVAAAPAELKKMAAERKGQVSAYGNRKSLYKGVAWDGIAPDFRNRFSLMAADYFKQTGKNIGITDGFRTIEQQVDLKNRKGDSAATPGTSMHGFGWAMDIDPTNANELDKMGLLRKYGFYRPLIKTKGETWHIETIGMDKKALMKNPAMAKVIADAKRIGALAMNGKASKEQLASATKAMQGASAISPVAKSPMEGVTKAEEKVAKKEDAQIKLAKKDSKKSSSPTGGGSGGSSSGGSGGTGSTGTNTAVVVAKPGGGGAGPGSAGTPNINGDTKTLVNNIKPVQPTGGDKGSGGAVIVNNQQSGGSDTKINNKIFGDKRIDPLIHYVTKA